MSLPVRRHRPSHERWLVSYADFITLLFAFFVVLYAFAKADQKQQAQIPQAIQSAFQSMGVSFGSKTVSPAASAPPAPTAITTAQQVRAASEVKEDLERLQRALAAALAGQVASGSVSIAMERYGLVISLHEAGFFASGSATPMPAASATLRRIAASLGSEPYDLRVEGHTDNEPIHSALYRSNWELSAARAASIARLLLEMRAVTPERLSIAGYGEFHPVASNDTPEGRALNRRVDLVVMPRTEIDYAAPSASASHGPWRRVTDGDQPATPTPSPSQ